jgi:hypothetical protein
MANVADINVEEETAKFEKKFKEGGFKVSRLANTELDYPREKQERDTQAVNEFAETEIFEHIMTME